MGRVRAHSALLPPPCFQPSPQSVYRFFEG
jgi:hypothetical protein